MTATLLLIAGGNVDAPDEAVAGRKLEAAQCELFKALEESGVLTNYATYGPGAPALRAPERRLDSLWSVFDKEMSLEMGRLTRRIAALERQLLAIVDADCLSETAHAATVSMLASGQTAANVKGWEPLTKKERELILDYRRMDEGIRHAARVLFQRCVEKGGAQ